MKPPETEGTIPINRMLDCLSKIYSSKYNCDWKFTARRRDGDAGELFRELLSGPKRSD